MKDKSKTVLALLAIVLLIVVIAIGIVIYNNNKTEIRTESNLIEAEEAGIDILKKPIEKDGIEVTNIHLTMFGADQLEVITTVKNKKNEVVDTDYSITIDLLDSEGNVVTTVSNDFEGTIEPGQSQELLSYVMDLKNPEKIVGAKIKTIDKDVKGTIEQEMEDMTSDEIEEE